MQELCAGRTGTTLRSRDLSKSEGWINTQHNQERILRFISFAGWVMRPADTQMFSQPIKSYLPVSYQVSAGVSLKVVWFLSTIKGSGRGVSTEVSLGSGSF